jgi:two-component system, cell cycle sensor histidine kinase and response regulator CckA
MLRGGLGVKPIMEETRPSGNGSVRTALVVEDEPETRALTRLMLERNGYAVVDAGDGQAALTLSRLHPGRIDLLLTDVVMPSMQGTELADAISTQRPGVVVVYMSGHALSAFGDESARPIAFLEKPFGEEDLLTVLQEHLPS